MYKQSNAEAEIYIGDRFNVKRYIKMSIDYRGETFSGYNKPKNDRTKTKKFSVLAKSGDTIKLIRFGDANMTIGKY
jgi:hypothetical protein